MLAERAFRLKLPCLSLISVHMRNAGLMAFAAMQGGLKSLDKDTPEGAKLHFRTNTRVGENGGKFSGTDWTDQGEFTFSFWASLYADDAAAPVVPRAALLAAASAIYDHLRKFDLLIHAGIGGKLSKTEAVYFPARKSYNGNGDTSDFVLDCGGITKSKKNRGGLRALLERGRVRERCGSWSWSCCCSCSGCGYAVALSWSSS
jgi:hypothetical protein